MRTMNRTAMVLTCLLLSAALFGTQGILDFTRPVFDPAPWVTPFSANRQTVISTIDEQIYSDGWLESNRYTADYDSQGRLSAQHSLYWSEDEGWLHHFTMNISYREDNRPGHVEMLVFRDGVWQPYGELNYVYQHDLLRVVRYDEFTETGRRAVWQSAFYYVPSTQILDMVMEIYYDPEYQTPSFFRKFQYEWDAGSRPSQITSSTMSTQSDWYPENRYTYVYHNDDQTTHAGYMRQLEFGWPVLTRMITGPQPTKLLEQRVWTPSGTGNNWTEMWRYFYVYDGSELQRIDGYDRIGTGDWAVRRQQAFTYENNLPITETWWFYFAEPNALLPGNRMVYSYTQISSGEDPIAVPSRMNLRVYPNPFNPSAGISYKLDSSLPTEVSVYNLKGQKVRTLFKGNAIAGDHNLNWDGRDDKGRELPAGIYLIRVDAGKQSSTVKAVLSK